MKKRGTPAQTSAMIKKSCLTSKRSQMQLSFGMIFSIILIIVFLAFAFYVIKTLLSTQGEGQVLMFKEDLQNDIDNLWKNAGSVSKPEGYSLPEKVEMVCFADFSASAKGTNRDLYKELKKTFDEFENLVFYPTNAIGNVDSIEINHINLEEMTSTENPWCIENKDGKVKLRLKRDYGEELVLIEEG